MTNPNPTTNFSTRNSTTQNTLETSMVSSASHFVLEIDWDSSSSDLEPPLNFFWKSRGAISENDQILVKFCDLAKHDPFSRVLGSARVKTTKFHECLASEVERPHPPCQKTMHHQRDQPWDDAHHSWPPNGFWSIERLVGRIEENQRHHSSWNDETSVCTNFHENQKFWPHGRCCDPMDENDMWWNVIWSWRARSSKTW